MLPDNNPRYKLRLSIITVSYNSEKYISQFLESLIKTLPQGSEIILLDNNSKDHTVEIIKKYHQIRLIENNENMGFSRGTNLAAKQALGEFLFFLNPDTVIKEPIFQKLIDFYCQTADAGIIAPKLVMPDGKVQASVKKLPSIIGAFKEFILGITDSYSEYYPKSLQPSAVECVYGAAILIRNDLFKQIGGFNPKYFMYYEDVDLCKKVIDAEKKIYYYPKAEVVHLVGASESELDRFKLNLESSRKYHGWFKTLLLQAIFIIPRIRNKLL